MPRLANASGGTLRSTKTAYGPDSSENSRVLQLRIQGQNHAMRRRLSGFAKPAFLHGRRDCNLQCERRLRRMSIL
jgi:hypothetical protein